MPTTNDKPFTELPLYRKLVSSFPTFRTSQQIFDVRGFAEAIEMSPEGVYKWLRADRLSADGARKIMALAKTKKSTLTREDLINFVLR
jgi:hypothetical protein